MCLESSQLLTFCKPFPSPYLWFRCRSKDSPHTIFHWKSQEHEAPLSAARECRLDESDLQRLAVNPSAAARIILSCHHRSDSCKSATRKDSYSYTEAKSKVIQCQWIIGNEFERDSFLRDMGIDDDLWLNVTFSADPGPGHCFHSHLPVSGQVRTFDSFITII